LNQLLLQVSFTTGLFAVAVISIRMTAVRVLAVTLWAALVATFVYSWFKDYGHLKRIVNQTRGAMG